MFSYGRGTFAVPMNTCGALRAVHCDAARGDGSEFRTQVPQPFAFLAKPCLHPQSPTLIPQPSNPGTPIFRTSTLNPQPSTLNPKPQTPNPKPHTLNLSPSPQKMITDHRIYSRGFAVLPNPCHYQQVKAVHVAKKAPAHSFTPHPTPSERARPHVGM